MARIIKNKTAGHICINDVRIPLAPGEVMDISRHVNMVKAHGCSLDLDKLIESGSIEEILNDEGQDVVNMAKSQAAPQPSLDVETLTDALRGALSRSDDADPGLSQALHEMIFELKEIKRTLGNLQISAGSAQAIGEAIAPTLDTGQLTAEIHAMRRKASGGLSGGIKSQESEGSDSHTVDDVASLLKQTRGNKS